MQISPNFPDKSTHVSQAITKSIQTLELGLKNQKIDDILISKSKKQPFILEIDYTSNKDTDQTPIIYINSPSSLNYFGPFSIPSFKIIQFFSYSNKGVHKFLLVLYKSGRLIFLVPIPNENKQMISGFNPAIGGADPPFRLEDENLKQKYGVEFMTLKDQDYVILGDFRNQKKQIFQVFKLVQTDSRVFFQNTGVNYHLQNDLKMPNQNMQIYSIQYMNPKKIIIVYTLLNTYKINEFQSEIRETGHNVELDIIDYDNTFRLVRKALFEIRDLSENRRFQFVQGQAELDFLIRDGEEALGFFRYKSQPFKIYSLKIGEDCRENFIEKIFKSRVCRSVATKMKNNCGFDLQKEDIVSQVTPMTSQSAFITIRKKSQKNIKTFIYFHSIGKYSHINNFCLLNSTSTGIYGTVSTSHVLYEPNKDVIFIQKEIILSEEARKIVKKNITISNFVELFRRQIAKISIKMNRFPIFEKKSDQYYLEIFPLGYKKSKEDEYLEKWSQVTRINIVFHPVSIKGVSRLYTVAEESFQLNGLLRGGTYQINSLASFVNIRSFSTINIKPTIGVISSQDQMVVESRVVFISRDPNTDIVQFVRLLSPTTVIFKNKGDDYLILTECYQGERGTSLSLSASSGVGEAGNTRNLNGKIGSIYCRFRMNIQLNYFEDQMDCFHVYLFSGHLILFGKPSNRLKGKYCLQIFKISLKKYVVEKCFLEENIEKKINHNYGYSEAQFMYLSSSNKLVVIQVKIDPQKELKFSSFTCTLKIKGGMTNLDSIYYTFNRDNSITGVSYQNKLRNGHCVYNLKK